jgi:RNA polymerase sigma factor (sigma-70 family)
MNKKVENYITTHYFELLQIAKKITKGHDLTQDLFHEVIIQLYDKDKIVLKKYDDNSIKYYIVAIMRINWYSNTSPFYYRVRREFQMYSDISECYDMSAEQESFEKEQILTILEQEWTELNWFNKQLFELYLTLGSLSKVSKQTRIPVSSISRYLKESKELIKINQDLQNTRQNKLNAVFLRGSNLK